MQPLRSLHRSVLRVVAFAAAIALSSVLSTSVAHADWRSGGGWHGGGWNGSGWHGGWGGHRGWGWRRGAWGCCWRGGGGFVRVAPPIYGPPPVYYRPPPYYYAPPVVYYPVPYGYGAPGY